MTVLLHLYYWLELPGDLDCRHGSFPLNILEGLLVPVMFGAGRSFKGLVLNSSKRLAGGAFLEGGDRHGLGLEDIYLVAHWVDKVRLEGCVG